MIPALLKWIGNKQRFADTIIGYMPNSFQNYYEPFLGSGAVMAALLDADAHMLMPHFEHAYGSDILPFLIEIFTIVKESPDVITQYYKQEIELYYDSPDEQYEKIRTRFNQNHTALDFCLLSRTCYSGVIRFRKNDGYMSTPRGRHFSTSMDRPQAGDVVYCDPPYTHSQSIIYGSQNFDINLLWKKIAECKSRGAKVILSINGTRESQKKDISITPPNGLFERKLMIDCGTSMIDRLQNSGKNMNGEKVNDQLLLTW